MKTSSTSVILALLTIVLVIGRSSAQDELPVSEGLMLWLDASSQAGARQAASLPPLNPMEGVDTLMDSSGKGRHFLQPIADRRPVLMSDGKTGFLRFDGKDDFLFSSGDPRLIPETTIFILAAPHENAGGFRGPFATTAAGGNDFTHGLNIDFGFQPTDNLSVVNVESAGASGMGDLLVPGVLSAAERPFGGFHLFTVRSRIAEGGNEFFLDGFHGGARDRLESMIGLDRMVLGGRLFSNDPRSAAFVQGHFDGDIAAVVAYDRWLSDKERNEVEQFLLGRVAKLSALASGKVGHALEVVDDPPAVQMLVPGFTVEEVPLKLGNLNNIRYRHDGKLVALGYDGRLHLLSDTDGDGAPDKADVWWDKEPLQGPIGLALLPAGDPRGEGAFVASKAKLSLILDRDRDGIADEEIVVATGWPPTFHGVDTLGVAIHPKDGSVYFSIGCMNFADGYLRDASGNSTYSLESVRGTVQRLSPDLKEMETVATGVRFLCALAFNQEGDLFATDQEGATWLPNGNPFDELLHIVPDRHYGFPPRHPRHLPDVLDEPAVFEYGPQHQSACGMIFNEGVNGGPAFGPKHWHGDAIVCGQSRGKIWRTKLVPTDEGYVAQNHLIACLNLLTVDSCVTPQGDLLIACHSGPPDWGTGPAGDGRLFRVKWTKHDVPQPVTAWASAPDEFRVAFDRSLETAEWAGVKDKVRIEAGKYVSAGDRYETVRPGYQVVRDQMASPRRWVDIESLQLTEDRRTLVLRVPTQTEPETYAVTIPLPDSWQVESGLPQTPEMDVAVTLQGIEASGAEGQKIILPHPSLSVSKAFTEASADHEAFFENLPSTVDLKGIEDVSNIFQPVTQPGSTLDWDVSQDEFANRRMSVRDAGSGEDLSLDVSDEGFAKIVHTLTGNSRLIFALDEEERPIIPQRLYIPWAKAGDGSDEPTMSGPRTDVAGNWLHGKRLYFGAAACWTCHSIRGEGMPFGPDLTNLIHRDRESVVHDILQPSATINPDHTGSEITLTDGSVVGGIIGVSDEEKLVVKLPAGAQLELARSDVASISPMANSLMPEALVDLSEEDMEDLLTFLLVNPLEPSAITRTNPGPPPARTLAEVKPFLPSPGQAPKAEKPLRILLSAGEKDHGPDEHDYPLWLERWEKLLSLADEVSVTTCMGFPTEEQLNEADVTVFYSANVGWDLRASELLDAYQERGGGLVYIHWSIEGHKHPRELADRVGLAFSMSAFRHGEMDLVFTPMEHPITQGFPSPIRFIDESYWKLHGDVNRLSILGTSLEDNEPRPQLWVREDEKSRVFGCIPGHYTWTFDDPLYRVLILRGICWAAHENDPNRLAELALIGARVSQD